MYVTLEPCAHHGRTPPCIDAILASGVRKVVAPMEDPNPQTRGRGFMRLRDAGIEVELAGDYAARATEINEPFVHFMRTGRPLVTLKAAVTLDGKIAAPEDNAGWITSETARAACADAAASDPTRFSPASARCWPTIAGSRTDPGLERSRPLLRIVLDSQLRLPSESHAGHVL